METLATALRTAATEVTRLRKRGELPYMVEHRDGMPGDELRIYCAGRATAGPTVTVWAYDEPGPKRRKGRR